MSDLLEKPKAFRLTFVNDRLTNIKSLEGNGVFA